MALMTTYNPLPISFTHGSGAWLYDDSGRAYLDTFSGIAVSGLGHAHPDVTHTIQTQAGRLLHTSNMVHIKEQQMLAEKLLRLTGMDQIFFGNSGAEVNEAAIKLSRLYGHSKGIDHPSVIVMDGAFHGRTMATLSASGSRKVQAGFEPLVPGFIRAPFNDIDAIDTIAANRDDIVGVMIEPIQGESGIHVADETYLRTLATLCETHDWMLIFDEIQTGNGRTGALYACMALGIQPDVLTTAKGLGNGVPIGACLMSKRACNLFKPGNHGSTFGGNPLTCATALTVLDVLERDKLCEQVSKNGAILKDQLHQTLREHPNVRAIRGKGYMLGIELNQPCMALRNTGLEHGLLVNVTADNVIRLLPPFILNDEERTLLVEKLVKTIDQFTSTVR